MSLKRKGGPFSNFAYVGGGTSSNAITEEATLKLMSKIISEDKAPVEIKNARKVIIFVLPTMHSAGIAFRNYSANHRSGSSLVLIFTKRVAQSGQLNALKRIKLKGGIIFLDEEALQFASDTRMINLKTVSAIFLKEQTISKLHSFFTMFQTKKHRLPRIYMLPMEFGISYQYSAIVMNSNPNCHPLSLSSSASLNTFMENPFILGMQNKGLVLQGELGLWASELYFSHALNHLAELVDKNRFSSVGTPLSLSHLVPCIIAANKVSRLMPLRNSPSISKKVEAILGLVKNRPPKKITETTVILAGCPFMAIYLQKVLACLYDEHKAVSEIAVARPEDYVGPLPAVLDALSSYSNGNVNVLVTTFDSLPLLSDQRISQLVFFDSTPPLLSYLDLKLAFPHTIFVLLPINNTDSQSVIDLEISFGLGLRVLKLYQPEAL